MAKARGKTKKKAARKARPSKPKPKAKSKHTCGNHLSFYLHPGAGPVWKCEECGTTL